MRSVYGVWASLATGGYSAFRRPHHGPARKGFALKSLIGHKYRLAFPRDDVVV
jgi:hypothetical protein